jgi:hypothetical protein
MDSPSSDQPEQSLEYHSAASRLFQHRSGGGGDNAGAKPYGDGTALDGFCDQVGDVAGPEPATRLPRMPLDCALGNVEDGGDLPRRFAFSQPTYNFALSHGDYAISPSTGRTSRGSRHGQQSFGMMFQFGGTPLFPVTPGPNVPCQFCNFKPVNRARFCLSVPSPVHIRGPAHIRGDIPAVESTVGARLVTRAYLALSQSKKMHGGGAIWSLDGVSFSSLPRPALGRPTRPLVEGCVMPTTLFWIFGLQTAVLGAAFWYGVSLAWKERDREVEVKRPELRVIEGGGQRVWH